MLPTKSFFLKKTDELGNAAAAISVLECVSVSEI